MYSGPVCLTSSFSALQLSLSPNVISVYKYLPLHTKLFIYFFMVLFALYSNLCFPHLSSISPLPHPPPYSSLPSPILLHNTYTIDYNCGWLYFYIHDTKRVSYPRC